MSYAYTSRHVENTVKFFYEVVEIFGFPIQRIQTDWATEFYNKLFQEELMGYFIKFRSIKPRSPHLNGKVHRALLANWEHFYNHKRPSSVIYSLRHKGQLKMMSQINTRKKEKLFVQETINI